MKHKFKLNYFSLGSDNSINLFFKSFEDLHNWFETKVSNSFDKKCVYLFVATGINKLEEAEIFVTERFGLIADLLNKGYFFGFDLESNFNLHEYDSFEDAYLVALEMKEGNELFK